MLQPLTNFAHGHCHLPNLSKIYFLLEGVTLGRTISVSMAQELPVGEDHSIEASRSHSDAPHSVGLLWTSDRPEAKTST